MEREVYSVARWEPISKIANIDGSGEVMVEIESWEESVRLPVVLHGAESGILLAWFST